MEENLKPEDHELFLNIGQTCIAQGRSAELLDFIKAKNNQGIVTSMGGALIGPLIKQAVKKESDPVHCKAVITHLVQNCDANKLLDILLKQVEDTDPHTIADTVILLMRHIQTVLLRAGDLKPCFLGLALNALHKEISKLPVPYSRKQEEEDEHGLCRCCAALLSFVQPFVQEINRHDADGPETDSVHAVLRAALLKFCMDSLKEPLLEAQFDRAETSHDSPLRHFATEIVAILSAIQEPLPKLLFYLPLRGDEANRAVKRYDKRATESRACLAYLLFVQHIDMEVFPAVFSPVFVLQCNLEYINTLLSRKEESWIIKGLDLYNKCLERTLDRSLPAELLELKSFYAVSQNLIRIMTECPIQHLKVKAFVVFQLLIEKLNGEAKYKYFSFRCTMETCRHAGVESVVLTNIKNQVERSSKSEKVDAWFEGTSLLTLLRDVLTLPHGSETDLLHGMDRIMVSLNLLRYLLLKEKTRATAMWTDLRNTAESYIKTLRVCLGMSKSFYKAELKRLDEEKRAKAKEFKEAAGKKSIQCMMVRNELLSKMPRDAQEKVLQCALVTYDLMESLIVRIEEVLQGGE